MKNLLTLWILRAMLLMTGAAVLLTNKAVAQTIKEMRAVGKDSGSLQSSPTLPFTPLAFETNPAVGSRWNMEAARSLRLNPHYIGGPAEGQDRGEWLKALKNYRQQTRAENNHGTIELNGTVGWIVFSLPLMRAMDLRPGDPIHYTIEVRHIAGNNRFAFTFDLQDRINDTTFVDWTGINGSVEIPADGQWHRLQTTVITPRFDVQKFKLLPVVGLDLNAKPPQGNVEVRLIDARLDDSRRMAALARAVREMPKGIDRSVYDRADQAWLAKAYTCHFSFLYDKGLVDAQTGRYRLKEFLEDGRREFGGYDALLLWQGYPRLGFDERNQFDFFKDLPGGLKGIADLVCQAHARGVKVFTDYNPWDTGTRRPGKLDEDMLAELVQKTGVDGVFLDTMPGASSSLRRKLERVRPGISICPEVSPNLEQLPLSNASWAQWLDDAYPPGLLHIKWIEPRHMQYQVRRWNQSHREEIRTAFFNGSGMLVWENIFGAYNPWNAQDRRMWRRAAAILHRYGANFASEGWDPFIPTLDKTLHAHRWPGNDGTTLYTLIKDDDLMPQGLRIFSMKAALLEVPTDENIAYYDLWNGSELQTERAGDKVKLIGAIDRPSGLGCVLAVNKKKVDKELLNFLARQRREASRPVPGADLRIEARPVLEAQPVTPTQPVPQSHAPEGMVLVPGGERTFHIEHLRGEFGCYPDPGTPADLWEKYLWGFMFNEKLTHEIGPLKIKPFYIDEAQVTNAQFKRFLEATQYRPLHPENFLKHWPGGKMPEELAAHPVVYVDLDDARAYAKWADRRLPTEYEWQLAAQGTDGRKWPWGNAFDAKRVNGMGKTMPARSLPEGRSPYGCYQMSGNVWELNESLRDDGHTRFLILRGGSYFKAEGSAWYAPSGPQPCDSHAKFILMWAGLDRCSTVGFRCVADTESGK